MNERKENEREKERKKKRKGTRKERKEGGRERKRFLLVIEMSLHHLKLLFYLQMWLI